MKEGFWITITGKYLNLEAYKNQDADFKQPEFVYNHMPIGDEPKKKDPELITRIDRHKARLYNASTSIIGQKIREIIFDPREKKLT